METEKKTLKAVNNQELKGKTKTDDATLRKSFENVERADMGLQR